MDIPMRKAIAILGPTAVGKTRIALEVAKETGGEIVSCDSMQIYRGMDIGTAKPSLEEQEQVPHHMIDLVDPHVPYSAARYQKEAKRKIQGIFQRGNLPIVSGGTGLYFNGLLYDMDFAAPPVDEGYRKTLYQMAQDKGNDFLHRQLQQKDPQTAERIHPNNTKRVVRALENFRESGQGTGEIKEVKTLTRDYQLTLFGLTRQRSALYERINQRVDLLMEQGLKQEVQDLLKQGYGEKDIAMKGIGYKELIGYFQGAYSLDDAVDLIKKNTRHYAKRQMTWFKRYEDMIWFDLTTMEEQEVIGEIVTWVQKNR